MARDGSDAWLLAAMAVTLPPVAPLLWVPAASQWSRMPRQRRHLGVAALILLSAVLAGAFYGHVVAG